MIFVSFIPFFQCGRVTLTFFHDDIIIEGPYADHILIPMVQLEVALSFMSNENSYFSHYNPQISA